MIWIQISTALVQYVNSFLVMYYPSLHRSMEWRIVYTYIWRNNFELKYEVSNDIKEAESGTESIRDFKKSHFMDSSFYIYCKKYSFSEIIRNQWNTT